MTEVKDKAGRHEWLEHCGVIVQAFAVAKVALNETPEQLEPPVWPKLDQVCPDARELKRVRVRPEAKGDRPRRALFEDGIGAARSMGRTILSVSAIRGTRGLLRICQSLGFRCIDRYPEAADLIAADTCFVFMQYELT